MDTSNTSEVQASTSRKRIPKACNPCRHSKVRCDEQRPCTRCRSLHKECVYIERPKTAEEIKIEELEEQIVSLRQQLASQAHPQSVPALTGISVLPNQHETFSPQSNVSLAHSSPAYSYENPLKRKRSRFSLQSESCVADFVTGGILTGEQASECFTCFFQGCDRYVPIFDTTDTLQSIRSRSSLLFNTICTVGCGVSENLSLNSRSLYAQLKRSLATVILSPNTHSLETVQALLIMACWMSERSLILAVATRVAIDVGLADAFDQLISLALAGDTDVTGRILMKQVRTWFGLLVLEKILQLDAGNLVRLKVKGVRRSRTLLNRPFSTTLDTRLFSQVELNHLRAKFNDAIASDGGDDLQAIIQDARIDIDVWYHDWRRIIETSPTSGVETPSLITNLTVQRHWADAMLTCRAIRATGLRDLSAMSTGQKALLGMAKEALQSHLDIILLHQHYLTNLKYAMDFVWAKCAYSFLLLVKLTRLLSTDLPPMLSEQGRALLEALRSSCTQTSSGVYLRLLEVTVEKCDTRERRESSELESFVPEEFVFEWDFPGLNLFSSSAGWDLLFDRYLLGDDLFFGLDV